jgi:hypothetical protein
LPSSSFGDTVLCAGTYTLINNSIGAETYFWTLPNGETSSAFEPTVTFEPGTYTLSLLVENNTEMCSDEEVKTFTFFALPEVQGAGRYRLPGRYDPLSASLVLSRTGV